MSGELEKTEQKLRQHPLLQMSALVVAIVTPVVGVAWHMNTQSTVNAESIKTMMIADVRLENKQKDQATAIKELSDTVGGLKVEQATVATQQRALMRSMETKTRADKEFRDNVASNLDRIIRKLDSAHYARSPN